MDTLTPTQKWAPYALRAGKELNMDPAFILSQWLYETGNGTNLGSTKYNNLAGIKSSPNVSKGIFDPSDSIHAGYSSLSAFTDDYVRVMKLGYYKDVRATATAGSNPISQLMAINKSPWAEADYSTTSWMKFYNQAAKVLGEKDYSLETNGSDILNVNTDGILTILKEKWWIVAGALVIIAVLK